MIKVKPRALFAIYGSIDKSLLSYGTAGPYNLRSYRKFFRESVLRQIMILDKETYLSLSMDVRLQAKTNIVITDDLLWVPTNPLECDIFKSVTTPWQALEKAENGPGEKICILGNESLLNFFVNNTIFDELHLASVSTDELFTISSTFPEMKVPLCGNYTHKNTSFKKGAINSHNYTISSFWRKK